jgi:chromate transporter
MTTESSTLLALAGYFAVLSLFAIGGANAALPEMHRLAVEVEHWMSDRQFADMFAIAQVTPGPNVIVVTLIGYHVAGLPGAVVATLAMCGPTCLFAFFIGRVWERFKDAHVSRVYPTYAFLRGADLDQARDRMRAAIQTALVPISIGLIGSSALVVTRAAAQSWLALAITAVTALASYRMRLNPLWIFAAAALLGLGGWI